MALRVQIEYATVAGLRREFEQHLKMGGFFAPVGAPAGLPPFAEVQLIFLVAGCPPVTARGRVTVANATSVCVEIPSERIPDLRRAIDAACAGRPAGGSPERTRVRFLDDADSGRHSGEAVALGQTSGAVATVAGGSSAEPDGGGRGESGAAGRSRPATTELPLARKIPLMSPGEKIQLAIHGDGEARALLVKERMAAVQIGLLKNPRLTLEEVMSLARSPSLHPEAAEAIARHPMWGDAAQVALMLIRNPKLPVAMAGALVAKLSPADLRLVAKGAGVRAPIAAAARKHLGA